MPKFELTPGPRLDLSGPVVEYAMPLPGKAMISPEAARQMTKQRVMRPAMRRRQLDEDVIRTTVDYRPSEIAGATRSQGVDRMVRNAVGRRRMRTPGR